MRTISESVYLDDNTPGRRMNLCVTVTGNAPDDLLGALSMTAADFLLESEEFDGSGRGGITKIRLVVSEETYQKALEYAREDSDWGLYWVLPEARDLTGCFVFARTVEEAAEFYESEVGDPEGTAYAQFLCLLPEEYQPGREVPGDKALSQTDYATVQALLDCGAQIFSLEEDQTNEDAPRRCRLIGREFEFYAD